MDQNVELMQGLKALGALLQQAQKHDTVQALGDPAHGTDMLFSEPGVRPSMPNAIQAPRLFIDALPVQQSFYENELISILTALTETTGSNPTGTCGTPPAPGALKKATIKSQFGKLFVGTPKVQVDEIGQLKNRADMERQIMNVAARNSPFTPDILTRAGMNFRSRTALEMFKLTNAVMRAFAPTLIDGNNTLANTATTLGWIKEFDGLARLVKTGYTDLDSGIAAPAADSHVVDWGTTLGGTLQGANIVKWLHDMYFSRVTLADDVGIDGTWTFVMDRRLFRALVFVWACVYANARCSDGSAGNPINRQSDAIEARANEMMRGQFLLLDGVAVPVLFTSGKEVSEPDESGNGLIGDIFLVNLTANGEPTTYVEYFPLNNEFINEWINAVGTSDYAAINNGMYLTTKRVTAFCEEWMLTGRFRMIHSHPFLSAKLTNVTFDSYTGYRDWAPGGTFYYGGGATYWNGS